MSVVALDVGGANLKAADGQGWAVSVPFELWKRPGDLEAELRRILSSAPEHSAVGLTMTGELADCYRDKAEGVTAICRATSAAVDGKPLYIYQTDGRLVEIDKVETDLAAASNWHALARFVGRDVSGKAVLVDVGSTTTDIIPLDADQVLAQGLTDPQRLISHELIYTGVVRSPIMGIARLLPYKGEACQVMQELFATTRDAYLILNRFPEDAGDCDTADGRPATREFAIERMARMFGADRRTFTEPDAIHAAEVVRMSQVSFLLVGWQKVVKRLGGLPETVVLSGQGTFLGRDLLQWAEYQGPTVSLDEQLGPTVSQAAPAHAVACLLREWTR